MAVLPDLDRLEKDPVNMSTEEIIIHATLVWIIIVANITLLFVIFANSWKILIKQGKWKTFPLLCFYTMSFISVTLRLLSITWELTLENWVIQCGFI